MFKNPSLGEGVGVGAGASGDEGLAELGGAQQLLLVLRVVNVRYKKRKIVLKDTIETRDMSKK